MSAAERLADRIDVFIDLVGRATSWLAFGLALVMGANVLLRYAFSLGWIWTQELEWHLLVPICLFGRQPRRCAADQIDAGVDPAGQPFRGRHRQALRILLW